MSTLTISINRTALSLSPLVLSGSDDGGTLGITGYNEPAMQSRLTYAPASAWRHGETPLASVWQQTILGFDVVTKVASEASSRALIAELVTAVSQGLNFLVTVTVDGASPEVWTCHPGTVEPAGGRTFTDLDSHDPEWSVTLPCYPVRA